MNKSLLELDIEYKGRKVHEAMDVIGHLGLRLPESGQYEVVRDGKTLDIYCRGGTIVGYSTVADTLTERQTMGPDGTLELVIADETINRVLLHTVKPDSSHSGPIDASYGTGESRHTDGGHRSSESRGGESHPRDSGWGESRGGESH